MSTCSPSGINTGFRLKPTSSLTSGSSQTHITSRDLRDLSGLDEPVKTFVFKFEETKEFYKRLSEMLEFLLPYYIEEGKRHLVIGIGCTGGRHRSVAVAQVLAEFLSEKGYPSESIHRDIDK